ncbi:MAG TPA: hypothetical protein DEB39_07790 [Planctomycetaceae bacterium]|nr:hypothetical protein [Planctomycetaceae bacterium]
MMHETLDDRYFDIAFDIDSLCETIHSEVSRHFEAPKTMDGLDVLYGIRGHVAGAVAAIQGVETAAVIAHLEDVRAMEIDEEPPA